MGPINPETQVLCHIPDTAIVCRNETGKTGASLPLAGSADKERIGPTNLSRFKELARLKRQEILPIVDGNIREIWDAVLTESAGGKIETWNGLSVYFEQELREAIANQDPAGRSEINGTLIDVGAAGVSELVGRDNYKIHRLGYINDLPSVAGEIIEYASSNPFEIGEVVLYQEVPQPAYLGETAYVLLDESIYAQGVRPSDTATIKGGLRIYKLPQEEDGNPELITTLLDYGEGRDEYLVENRLIAFGDRLITLGIKINPDGKSVLLGVFDPENPDSLDMHEYPMGAEDFVISREEKKVCITINGFYRQDGELKTQKYIEIKSNNGEVRIEETSVPSVIDAINEKYADDPMSYVPLGYPNAIVSETGGEYTLYALGYGSGSTSELYETYFLYNLRLVKNNETGKFEIMRGENGSPLVDRIELDTSPYKMWQIDEDGENMQMHIINKGSQQEGEEKRTIVLSTRSEGSGRGLAFAAQFNPAQAEGEGKVKWMNINEDLDSLSHSALDSIDIKRINRVADGKFAVYFKTEAGSYIAVYEVRDKKVKIYMPLIQNSEKPARPQKRSKTERRKAEDFIEHHWRLLTDFQYYEDWWRKTGDRKNRKIMI